MISKDIERKLSEATQFAKKKRNEFVTLEHVFLFLCELPNMASILESIGIQVPEFKKFLTHHLENQNQQITEEQLELFGGFESWNPEFTLACHRLIQRAALQVKNSGRNQINEGTLLVALFYETDSHALSFLTEKGITQFDVINFISHGTLKIESSLGSTAESTPDYNNSSKQTNSVLESLCVNLNAKFSQIEFNPLVGRSQECQKLMQILLRSKKNNPLLVGEPGVGKTALIEGLAYLFAHNQVPEPLKGKIIYSLEIGNTLAGTKFRGEFEARWKNLLKEISERKNVILFIDEIHSLVGAGSVGNGALDAANLLKPALSSGNLVCIGSTTHSEYRQYFEKDRALLRRFQKVDLKEPDSEECYQILCGIKKNLEEHHDVTYSNEALLSSIELSQKYILDKLLPDKAIDLLDEAGSKTKFIKNENLNKINGKIQIGRTEIEAALCDITGLPPTTVSQNEKLNLKDLNKKLLAHIYGQDEAINVLTQAIKLSRSGLSSVEKPIGSFLFTGPTGVGKTELARQLALVLGLHLERFDMSEYMEKHSISKLIGAPPGYVGYESGGLLTEALHKNPYCVLLLDEFEKAHSDLAQALLQIMDAGRLTDSHGRVTSFRNCILIMTTNAGALEMTRGTIGIQESTSQNIALDTIKKTFSPEFVNRLSAIVPFQNLNFERVLQVAQKFVDELRFNLAQKKVDLQLTSSALKYLAEKGYDKAYGARPMGRALDLYIKNPLVDELLFGRLMEGGKVLVDLQDNVLKFQYIPLRSDEENNKLVHIEEDQSTKT